MTDKERMLFKIIERLSTTQTLENPSERNNYDKRFGKDSNLSLVHFEPNYKTMPKKGDLVLCQTINICPFKVGFVDTIFVDSEMIIREIGTNNTCRIHNENFEVIVGMRKEDLYDRHERVFYEKVVKAFYKNDSYLYVYGDLDLYEEDGKKKAKISVRKKWMDLAESETIPIEMEWNSRTSIKSIVKKMVDSGYGKDR